MSSLPESVQTRFTQLVNIRYPIVQGGHLSYAELAAAVSNAGGLGQIGNSSYALLARNCPTSAKAAIARQVISTDS
jgi:NAD(P)H-dependent flavin oxidoreductase YrpB (nitropropane dioxygenase family)